MKRYIYRLLILLTIIAASSCESYLIHGNLDGFWQVESIEDKNTGDITYCDGDTYYSFQRELVLVSYVSPNIPTGQIKENYIAHFTCENDSIYFTVTDTTGFYRWDCGQGGWNLGFKVSMQGYDTYM